MTSAVDSYLESLLDTKQKLRNNHRNPMIMPRRAKQKLNLATENP